MRRAARPTPVHPCGTGPTKPERPCRGGSSPAAPGVKKRPLHSNLDGDGRAAAAPNQNFFERQRLVERHRVTASLDSSATIASTARRAAATASSSLPRTTIWLLKRPSLNDG